MKTGIRQSPDWVRTSTAAVMTMGIAPGRFLNDAKLHCLNLLLTYDEGCSARCAYCGLSRSRDSKTPWADNSFIRVEWPTVAVDEVVSKIRDGDCPAVERVCVSMVTNPRAFNDTLTVVARISPVMERVSALITPTIIDRDWLVDLKEAGADMVGIAVDAATEEIFDETRGRGVRGPHRWDRYWESVSESVEVFGIMNAGVHLIVGIGETEREMIETIQRVHDMGAFTHLFSFFPEVGSLMQNSHQPPIEQYRRVQLARYLIDNGSAGACEMTFDHDGRLNDYGIKETALDKIISQGYPFMTSGCHGKTLMNACNRPFGNCTPLQALQGQMRNFPYKPRINDIKIVRAQMGIQSGLVSSENS
ncbi:radical SAM protein [Candidatus Bathyarchaeota archaeon]|nr:radical SAM protein [Candidatus Bathyarchaeota archaeon]